MVIKFSNRDGEAVVSNCSSVEFGPLMYLTGEFALRPTVAAVAGHWCLAMLAVIHSWTRNVLLPSLTRLPASRSLKCIFSIR